MLQSFSLFTEGFLPIRDDLTQVESTISNLKTNLSYWILVPLFVGVNLPLNAIVNLIYLQEFEKFATLSSSQIFDLVFAFVVDAYIFFVFSMNMFTYE